MLTTNFDSGVHTLYSIYVRWKVQLPLGTTRFVLRMIKEQNRGPIYKES